MHVTAVVNQLPQTFLRIISHIRCDDNYKGSRCEQFQLFSISTTAGQAGLIAAVVIVSLLSLVVLAIVIYYICK